MVWAKVIVHLITPILPPSLLYYAFMHMVAYVDDEYSDDIFLLGEIFCGIDFLFVEKLEKDTEIYFVCNSLSVQSSHILTHTWLLFMFLGLTIHPYGCMSWKSKKKHISQPWECLWSYWNNQVLGGSTESQLFSQQGKHAKQRASQTKPNQWLLYLHVTGKVQLTSSLVASGDWGHGGPKSE